MKKVLLATLFAAFSNFSQQKVKESKDGMYREYTGHLQKRVD